MESQLELYDGIQLLDQPRKRNLYVLGRVLRSEPFLLLQMGHHRQRGQQYHGNHMQCSYPSFPILCGHLVLQSEQFRTHLEKRQRVSCEIRKCYRRS